MPRLPKILPAFVAAVLMLELLARADTAPAPAAGFSPPAYVPLPVASPEVPPVSGVTAMPASSILTPLSAQEVNASAKSSVFRLSTYLERANSRAQHGTAFAIDTAGLLITNFHVVRDALLGGKDYRLVLEAAEGSVPATVVAVDVVNDLALVRAGIAFEKVVKIAQQGSAMEGEVVFSMGFPANEQLTFIQGNYGGEKAVGFVTSGFATMPLNSGMSGGPMLNSQAEVIGVNRAIITKAQNLSYFSPLGALKELIARNTDAGRSLASTNDSWKAEAVASVKRQENLTLDLKASGKRERLGDVSFTVPLPNQKCGQSKVGGDDDLLSSELFVCQSNSLTPLVGEANALEVVTVGSASDKSIVKFAAPVQRALFGMYRKERAEILNLKKRAPASIDESSLKKRENCGLKNVTNGHGVEMTVSYCTIANAFYEGLFSTFVRIEVRGRKSNTTSLVQMYQGLSAEATANVLGQFLESVQTEGGS